MKTVHIPLLAMNRSGGVRVVAALANGLAARGVAVRFLVPAYAADPPVPLHESIAVDVIPTRSSKLDYMRRLISAIRRCDGLIVSTGYLTPALIHVAAPGEATMVSLIQGAETESHIRHGRRPEWMKPFLSALARLGYRIPGHKIAVSGFVADAVGRANVDEVINPGIRSEFIDCIPPDGAVRDRGERLRVGVLSAGGAAKGTHHAIAALRALEGDVSAVVYDVDRPAGDFPPAVERYSAIAAPGERDIVSFYSSCDVFILPSLVEGFALPPLEAMACGAAVVVADCGGIRDYAVDGRNALIVPVASAAAMAAAVRRLAADEALRRRLVAEGYRTAASLPEARFVQRAVESILRLLRG